MRRERLLAARSLVPMPSGGAASHGAQLLGLLDSEVNAREGLAPTASYLMKHNVKGVLLECLSHMVEQQPEDPKEFLLDYLHKVKMGTKQTQFTVKDLETMFEMMDVMGSGKISTSKVDEAVELLRPEGLRPGEQPPQLPVITGPEQVVTKQQFVAALEPVIT